MKKLFLLIYCMIPFSGSWMMAQSGILKGTIKDKNNNTVPFANVALYTESKTTPVTGCVSDLDGNYMVTTIPQGIYKVKVNAIGYTEHVIEQISINDSSTKHLNIILKQQSNQLEAVTVCDRIVKVDQTVQKVTYSVKDYKNLPSRSVEGHFRTTSGLSSNGNGYITLRGSRSNAAIKTNSDPLALQKPSSSQIKSKSAQQFNTNEFSDFQDNEFLSSHLAPLSTFSVDVDKASYTLVRKFIKDGVQPVRGAVRLEEMLNYFDYNYADPTDQHPFNIITELTECPWNKDSKILKLALQGKRIPTAELPPSVFTFLIDVSGSMNAPNRLPLVKASLLKLLESMRPQDKVGIVVYAGAAGIVLEPRSAEKKSVIVSKIMEMEAGGSTAGGQGIQLAYKLAEEHFVKDGNNRIILCTDGDFNVGISSESELTDLIEKERQKGIFLTVLGYGMGNYKDNKLELLANKGNGNYAYIDDYSEAEKFLGKEFAGTMYTIAKDVKIQIEFNPEFIKSYRLIGYENRVLAAQDFNDDKKDAGEIGAGHTVTALYEIRADEKFCKKVDSLKYHRTARSANAKGDEIATVKFRYKKPDGNQSILIQKTLDGKTQKLAEATENTRFAIAVAAFGMTLRQSEYIKEVPLEQISELASAAKTYDPEGLRNDFISMIKDYKQIVSITKK